MAGSEGGFLDGMVNYSVIRICKDLPTEPVKRNVGKTTSNIGQGLTERNGGTATVCLNCLPVR